LEWVITRDYDIDSWSSYDPSHLTIACLIPFIFIFFTSQGFAVSPYKTIHTFDSSLKFEALLLLYVVEKVLFVH